MIIGGDVEPAKFFWLQLSCPDTSPSLDRRDRSSLRPSSSPLPPFLRIEFFQVERRRTFVFSLPVTITCKRKSERERKREKSRLETVDCMYNNFAWVVLDQTECNRPRVVEWSRVCRARSNRDHIRYYRNRPLLCKQYRNPFGSDKQVGQDSR